MNTGYVTSGEVIVCPKCGNDEVEIMRLDTPKLKKVSMDELGKRTVQCEPAVLKYHNYRAVCKHCNYTKDYVE